MEESKTDLGWVYNYIKDQKAIKRSLGEGINTKIFVGKDSMLSFVRLEPFTQGSFHSHPEEQWGVLIEGKCIRIQNGREIEMEVGDFWYSGPNEAHGVRTTNSHALILDVFSPPRPDYKRTGSGFGIEKEENR